LPDHSLQAELRLSVGMAIALHLERRHLQGGKGENSSQCPVARKETPHQAKMTGKTTPNHIISRAKEGTVWRKSMSDGVHSSRNTNLRFFS